jgi:UDPglucose--hexose-1-phosphate uridylyltransferase
VNTPDESLRYCDASGLWQVRCFPNRYPVLTQQPGAAEQGRGFRRKLAGHGVHDVIAESPRHNTTLALMSDDQVALVVRAWRERYLQLIAMPGIEHVITFKNHGVAGGTSLEHPHSQIVGLPVLPSPVRGRTEVARRYFHKNGRCVFCDMLESELEEGSRIVLQTDDYVALVPFAAYSPYSIWLCPRQHQHCFATLDERSSRGLAAVLRDLLHRYYHGLGDPSFNLVVRSAPPPGPGTNFFHWYLAIVPRLSRLAGFEMGTGMFINASSPEGDAEVLRGLTSRPGPGPTV